MLQEWVQGVGWTTETLLVEWWNSLSMPFLYCKILQLWLDMSFNNECWNLIVFAVVFPIIIVQWNMMVPGAFLSLFIIIYNNRIRRCQYAPYLADEGTETLGSKRTRRAWALNSSSDWLQIARMLFYTRWVPVPVSSWTIYWSPCLVFLPSHSLPTPPPPTPQPPFPAQYSLALKFLTKLTLEHIILWYI